MNRRPERRPSAPSLRRLSRDGCAIAWREAGHPRGHPVVVLHGGPGSGSRPAMLRLFDLQRMRVVLVDQRGAGASTPRGGLRHNNTMRLIDDLEALRVRLGIARWGVVGGSWGAALALAYAGRHPAQVTGVVLRGLFLTSARELRAFFVGSRARAPRAWRQLAAAAGTSRADRLLAACARGLRPGVDAGRRRAIARAWSAYEDALLAGAPARRMRTTPRALDRLADKYRIQAHYLQRRCWLGERRLLSLARRAAHAGVPLHAVHGTRDAVCPVDNVARLARAVPTATVERVPAGHLASDAALARRLAGAIRTLFGDA
ncbi:alpha/beta hydrolase [Burkholderia multivorans]|uniref:alpha/beta fold hydrolase n=3 Tax=Burkholderia multivorans TaxID=87883 RepID=UPI0005D9C73A|nr:alpha/beta fold hydrolase [Burkholderia multivorans]AJY14974.1 alpha/beta hydrolase family protein [Burkholderia multivorans ATCC BAA-247]AVR20136.1 prolyl aminopeptidase [Burkholderia multivorans]EKS9916331.1 alpha/beta fold hydrolase [Burkholderia multivorans]MBU9181364.1 alpha/beta hydrolase [Burkholderia multivorans]MBU9336076.1 alpha/beta hydrolase [Burkholderia multivorans]